MKIQCLTAITTPFSWKKNMKKENRMSNIEKYPKCHMRTSLGNCDPIGGFCTSVNKAICEALHKAAEPKTGRDCTDFVRWLMDEVMDEENWQMNAVANGEIICRKLKKLSLLDVEDGYYVETQKTGQWEMKPDPYGCFEDIPVCSECGHTTEMRRTYNYCPHCGARMRGW